jgi:hypothetical protein
MHIDKIWYKAFRSEILLLSVCILRLLFYLLHLWLYFVQFQGTGGCNVTRTGSIIPIFSSSGIFGFLFLSYESFFCIPYSQNGRAVVQVVSRWAVTAEGGPRSIPGRSMWDLWWTKWHWDKFFSEYFGFSVSISFHRCSIKMEKQINPNHLHHLPRRVAQ